MADQQWNRRDFVRMGMLGGATLAGTSAAAAPKPLGMPTGKKALYRTLGRTKLKVSEISFGSFGFSSSAVLDAALNAGINFILTAGPYQNGQAEEAIGKILAKRRKDAIVMTGWIVRDNTTKSQILEQLDKSLQRLQTDHIEIMRAHMCSRMSQVRNPALLEAFDVAKKAKKAKFLGLSTHGGDINKILQYAAECGKFDVLMFKYNFMEHPGIEEAIKPGRKKNLGLVVFKVDAGKREKELEEFTGKGLDLAHARKRWALKNPAISSVIGAFSKFEDVRNAIETMSKKFSTADAVLLERYRQAFWDKYCRYCGTCEGQCPHGVAVADVMRYAMYFKYYGREKDSMELYAALPSADRANPCDDCPGYCMRACPYGIDTRAQLVEAHGLLSVPPSALA